MRRNVRGKLTVWMVIAITAAQSVLAVKHPCVNIFRCICTSVSLLHAWLDVFDSDAYLPDRTIQSQ